MLIGYSFDFTKRGIFLAAPADGGGTLPYREGSRAYSGVSLVLGGGSPLPTTMSMRHCAELNKTRDMGQ